jgi:hypothetical protein
MANTGGHLGLGTGDTFRPTLIITGNARLPALCCTHAARLPGIQHLCVHRSILPG